MHILSLVAWMGGGLLKMYFILGESELKLDTDLSVGLWDRFAVSLSCTSPGTT